jgi:phosphopantetheine--protein transferase-like protein
LKSRAWIGNDIVDLAEPGVSGKEGDRRFLDRVFTAEERARILAAAAPTIELWKAWTAKETAYKIAGKIREKVIFAHRAFEVVVDRRDARVHFEDLVVRVRWEVAREYIHCVGELAGEVAGESWSARRMLAAIAHHAQAPVGALTPAEHASVHSTASASARLLARRLLEQWNLRGAEVLREWRARGWGPPLLARHGVRLQDFDVSLSHDGRFVAAALAGPR